LFFDILKKNSGFRIQNSEYRCVSVAAPRLGVLALKRGRNCETNPIWFINSCAAGKYEAKCFLKCIHVSNEASCGHGTCNSQIKLKQGIASQSKQLSEKNGFLISILGSMARSGRLRPALHSISDGGSPTDGISGGRGAGKVDGSLCLGVLVVNPFRKPTERGGGARNPSRNFLLVFFAFFCG
jgi:hypothetical protein